VFLNVWAAHNAFKFTDWAHHVEIFRGQEGPSETIKGDVFEIFGVEDRAFINAVVTGDRSGIRCTHADGVRTTLVALAANESFATGKPVTVKY